MSVSGAGVNLPSWLHRALYDRTYQKYVFSVLDDRERTRGAARSLSRQQNSKVHRSFLRNSFSSTKNPNVPEPYTEHYRVDAGTRRENVTENRYLAIEPFDRTRVVVGADAEGRGRYLNANWVRELHGGHWWIAMQAPLPHTAHPFLSLMIQHDTRPPAHLESAPSLAPGACRLRTVVQLTLASEGGRTKAHPYFPSRVGESHVIPAPKDCSVHALKITLEAEREVKLAGCVQSTLRLVHCTKPSGEVDMLRYKKVQELGEPVFFTHLLFSHWPDFGVPEGPEQKAFLLAFSRLVADVNCSAPPSISPDSTFHPDPPIVVHCSAGVGRTGSFIALNSLLRAHGMLSLNYDPASLKTLPGLPPSPQGPLPSGLVDDEVAAEVDSLREQRTSMVQRPEQQFLVYELLAAAYYEVLERAASDSNS